MDGDDPIHADLLYFNNLLPPQLHLQHHTDHLNHQLSDSRESPEKEHSAAGSGGQKRRSRGRPYGLKNKPKPPTIAARQSPNSLRSHVLEVSSGEDIVETVSVYARRRGRGICVLSGGGQVADITLKPPEGSFGCSLVTLQGRFEILSLSGTVLPPPAPPGSSGLSLFLSGREGQVVGGSVVGRLVASGPVVLMAASFASAVFERLPLDEMEEEAAVPEAMKGQQKSAYESVVVTSGGGASGGNGGEEGGSFPFSSQVGGQNYNIGSFPFSSDFHGWSEKPPF